MRVGDNPAKDKSSKNEVLKHLIIVPVSIPNNEGYHLESFSIFKLCLKSIFKTVSKETHIAVLANNCCLDVIIYLRYLFDNKIIHELIETDKIGKINSVLKGLIGRTAQVVTISDSDILFQPGWQEETFEIFKYFPKSTAVGIIPMFNLHLSPNEVLLFDNLFSKRTFCQRPTNLEDFYQHYDSILTTNYYRDSESFEVGYIKSASGKTVLIGNTHCVSSFRGNIFEDFVSFNYDSTLEGKSDRSVLDLPPIFAGGYRLTTSKAFARHMGNRLEPWMKIDFNEEISFSIPLLPVFKRASKTIVNGKIFIIRVFKKMRFI